VSLFLNLSEANRVNLPKVAYLHPYIEARRVEIQMDIYPKQHLWGCDAIETENCWKASKITSVNSSVPRVFEKVLNRMLFRNSPGIRHELAAWKASKSNDFIYSVCGPLSLARFYKKCTLLPWVFQPLTQVTSSPICSYFRSHPNVHAGFLCLTPKAEDYFSQFAPSRFIPWCVDMDLFDGRSAKEMPAKPFFLATGKTGRDYKTLVEGGLKINAEVRIIGPSNQKPDHLPPSVQWIDTSSNPPDQAIDYPTLREWYAQCTAVCIPLSGDADDTCGYTNMLEGMAMRKPVLMTRSGCLHVDPESGGFGKLIEPQDSKGWTHAMNDLLVNENVARKLGETGRQLVERDFTIERFNRDVLEFIKELFENQ
jgi:glycosyltransferase involved in cell wall biosynthesis